MKENEMSNKEKELVTDPKLKRQLHRYRELEIDRKVFLEGHA